MENDNLGDYEALVILRNRYNDKLVLKYYLAKAMNAMRQAEVAITGPNTELYISNAAEVFANLKMIDKILSDPKAQVSGEAETKK